MSELTSGELLLHSEERGIDECSEAQRTERAMDKTLADSFPASHPPRGTSESGCPIRVLCRKELYGGTRHCGRVSIAKNRRRQKQLKKVRRNAA
jgi:hypothetical protein